MLKTPSSWRPAKAPFIGFLHEERRGSWPYGAITGASQVRYSFGPVSRWL
jgi:hypothetical protein